MLIKKATSSMLIISFLLLGCASKEEEIAYEPTTTEKGPTKFNNSGTLRCSEDSDNLDSVCDYRSIQKAKYTIMWIEDIASPDLIRYRVFKFDYKTHKFLARNGDKVKSSEHNKKYLVEVANSYYLISHRSLTEGYSYKPKSVF